MRTSMNSDNYHSKLIAVRNLGILLYLLGIGLKSPAYLSAFYNPEDFVWRMNDISNTKDTTCG